MKFKEGDIEGSDGYSVKDLEKNALRVMGYSGTSVERGSLASSSKSAGMDLSIRLTNSGASNKPAIDVHNCRLISETTLDHTARFI